MAEGSALQIRCRGRWCWRSNSERASSRLESEEPIGDGTTMQLLPDAHTDFVLSGVAEPLGLAVGVLLVCALAYSTYCIFAR